MRKFVGRWYKTWDEDRSEYGAFTAPDFDKALAGAIEGSLKADVNDWVSVQEYEWVGHKITGYWREVARWSGDREFQEQVI